MLFVRKLYVIQLNDYIFLIVKVDSIDVLMFKSKLTTTDISCANVCKQTVNSAVLALIVQEPIFSLNDADK